MLEKLRKRVFEVIEAASEDDALSRVYDWLMMATIVISMLPLAFKGTRPGFQVIDIVTAVIFILDYLLRLFTADFKMKLKRPWCFIAYPFSPMALIDLVSILPSLAAINGGLKLLRVFRLARTFRVLRTLKFIRYSKSVLIIFDVFRRQKRILITVLSLAAGYVLIAALLIFNVEPDSFETFFDAVYWATVSLTTVGYGDIYPVSTIGRAVAMASSIFGIAIIALPSGVVTAGYLDEIRRQQEEERQEEEREKQA